MYNKTRKKTSIYELIPNEIAPVILINVRIGDFLHYFRHMRGFFAFDESAVDIQYVHMDAKERNSLPLRKYDYALLAAAAGAGVIATLRSFGVNGVTLPAAALLAVAALLALGPMIRMLGGGGLQERYRKTVIAVIFGAHLVGIFFFFPPEDLFNDRPVLTLDHTLHFYQAERARAVSASSHRLYTYDPYFMAGYPGGTVFDIDSKGVEMWCSLLRFFDTARAYKLFIFLGYLLIPFTVYSGCRRMRYRYRESIYAVLVTLAFWHWGRPYVSDFRFAGMFSYLIICHLSIYLMGLFRSFFNEDPVKRFYLFGPLAFFIHPTAAVLLPVPFLALFFTQRRLIPRGQQHRKWEVRILFKLLLWCMLILAVNAIWLVPFFRYLDIKISSETFFQIAGIPGLLKILVKPGNFPALFLIALALAGFVHLLKTRRYSEAAAPAAGSAFLFIIASFGIYIPLFDQMEPGRFLLPAILFAAPLAGAGLVFLMDYIKKLFPSRGLHSLAMQAAVILLLLCSPVFSLFSSREYYRHTLSTTYTAEVRELLHVLDRHTESSGRLMIEDGPAWNYGDSFLPAIIPLHTGVEQIGGPYPFAFIKHNFSNFRTCRAMETPLHQMKDDRLLDYLELYNVHWILTATQECSARIKELPGIEAVWSSTNFTLWTVSPNSSFSTEWGVTVRSAYNLLDVTIATDTGHKPPEKVLLKYHWDRGLDVAPPARISAIMRLDDPVPFILLEPNGETDIRITFR